MTDLVRHEDFERDWLQRHKGSIIRKPRISSWGLIFGIGLWGLIALGAALVSGAHSIPAILQTIPQVVPSPYREILSMFGFTILEMLIFAGAMYRRESRFASWGLTVGMVGALAANVGSSIHAVMENGGDPLNLLVAIILALIAPLAAFLAGEMIHLLKARHEEIIRAAWELYDQKRRELDATINREYARHMKQIQSVNSLNSANENRQLPTFAVHSVNSANEQVNEQNERGYSVNSASGYSKRMDARSLVQEFFRQHPERVNGKLDELVVEIERESGVKVGRTSIHNVRCEMSEGNNA